MIQTDYYKVDARNNKRNVYSIICIVVYTSSTEERHQLLPEHHQNYYLHDYLRLCLDLDLKEPLDFFFPFFMPK